MIKIVNLVIFILISTLSLNAAVQRVTTDYIQITEDGTYVGNSLNQTYSIDPAAIPDGGSITIIDQKGDNTIELVGGLTITASQVVSDELILTLSNATTINVRGADTFTYDVGANSASGTTGTQQNFSTFVTDTLGLASVPTQAVVSGGAINPFVAGAEDNTRIVQAGESITCLGTKSFEVVPTNNPLVTFSTDVASGDTHIVVDSNSIGFVQVTNCSTLQ